VGLQLGSVLVVDDSPLCLQLVATLLEPYSSKVTTASSGQEAIAHIDEGGALDLIVCDVVMDDGNGFSVLEHVQQLASPRPGVLLITAFPSEEDRQKAERMGALGYLAKPTTLRQILEALQPEPSAERRQQKPRSRCSGTATLVSPDSGSSGAFVWDVYNISPGGALLETKGPLPVGTELELLLDLRGRQVRVRARVARVQAPSWLEVGGVGVEFLDPCADAAAVIRRVIEQPPNEG
jgi:CheY-like chemotaxis protein